MAPALTGAVLLDSLGPGIEILNRTDFTNEEVFAKIDPNTQVFESLKAWAGDLSGPMGEMSAGFPGNRRVGGIMDRDRYVTPINFFEQMRLAYHASINDDVVSTVLENTEALAFSRVKMYADDEEDEDVYNQIAEDIDLDSRLREMWRELFCVSQFYAAVWWDDKEYKVRGVTDTGKKSKKKVKIRVPHGVTLLDPLKIVPVGNFLFGQEGLAYVADRGEDQMFLDTLNARSAGGSQLPDPFIDRIIVGPYEPNFRDQVVLDQLGIGRQRGLFLLNPNTVFRHTLTRPSFQPTSPVRMTSIFELLDLKSNLRQMERAHLIGGTNFIIVITQGSDKMPAQAAELQHLQASVRVLSRTPVMVGDHRLNVEIVTPKIDTTLRAERHNTLDSRITARLYNMFMLGNYSAGAQSDDSVKLVKVIARGIESRRDQLARSVMSEIFNPIYTMNDALQTEPKMRFHPKSVALDFDVAKLNAMIDLRANREVSRDTIHSMLDLDQAEEAKLMEREAEQYDDIFMTHVPFDGSTPIPHVPSDKSPGDPGYAAPGGDGTPPAGGGDPAQPPESAGHTVKVKQTGDIEISPAKAPADKTQKAGSGGTSTADKRRAGRQGGGTRNGGGAAPGSGQGQAPAGRKPKDNGGNK